MTQSPAISVAIAYQQQLGIFKAMGMYDTIIFNRESLSGIDERVDKYLSLIEGSQISFQTKDLECYLLTYKVKNGQLFYEKVEREWVESDGMFGGYMNEISRSLEKREDTVTVYFYDLLFNDVADIWIEFKAVFIKGVLDKIELFKFEETCSKDRIEREKEAFKKMSEYFEYSKTLRGKISIFCKGQIYKSLNKLSQILRKITSLVDKLKFKF